MTIKFFKKISFVIVPFIFLIGCERDLQQTKKPFEAQNKKIEFEKKVPPIYVKYFKRSDKVLNTIVSFNKKEVKLINSITLVMPNVSVVAGDEGVDLLKVISMNINNNTFSEYLKRLEELTGYEIVYENDLVVIKSISQREWNLAAVSKDVIEIKSSSGEADGESFTSSDLSAGSDNKANEWISLIDSIKKILGQEAVVSSNQKLGLISAIGNPIKMRRADRWIEKVIESSNKQIHLKVSVLDVSVDEAVGSGIDWSIISEGVNGKFKIGNSSPQSMDGAGALTIGTLSGEKLKQGEIGASFLVNLLRKQGNVKVQNQPNLTVVNGKTAYISTGNAFSYTAKLDSTSDQNGNVVVTADIKRMKVGVDLLVTPKILEDGRIVITVVPIISSLINLENIDVGTGASRQKIQNPRTTLQKLSTQAIVKSGGTIHLGGLIAERVKETAKNLPNGKFNFLFDSSQKEMERREIVVLITPTTID